MTTTMSANPNTSAAYLSYLMAITDASSRADPASRSTSPYPLAHLSPLASSDSGSTFSFGSPIAESSLPPASSACNNMGYFPCSSASSLRLSPEASTDLLSSALAVSLAPSHSSTFFLQAPNTPAPSVTGLPQSYLSPGPGFSKVGTYPTGGSSSMVHCPTSYMSSSLPPAATMSPHTPSSSAMSTPSPQSTGFYAAPDMPPHHPAAQSYLMASPFNPYMTPPTHMNGLNYSSPLRFNPYHLGAPYRVQYVPSRPYKCPTCNQSFSRNHDLKRHVKIHSGVKPHQCQRCGKRFGRSDALKRHSLVKRCRNLRTTTTSIASTQSLPGGPAAAL
ncbi:hypothetical protein H4R33_000146 [Dimargaris cristalligena]|nr:hypothetical protein H4R33_000146 [Dimargaris cristalligena]